LEGVSQQIEQAKMFEDGCESENDNIKAAVAGTYAKNHSLFTVCRKACFRLNDVVKRLLFIILCFFMAAVWNRAGHYIFAQWFLLSIYLSIFFLFFLT